MPCQRAIIQRITIDYHRITKIKPGVIPDGAEWEYVTWDYTERLTIDRSTETLEHIQNIGTGCHVTRKYEVEEGISGFLDDLEASELFAHVKGNPDDVVETPNESRDYTITIDYKQSPQRTITGSYDKNGLPEDFADFVESVFHFMCFYGMGEMFTSSVYGKIRRRKQDYIYCSVMFDSGYKSYYYITEDNTIEVGDYVVVPGGKDNHEAIVEVVKVEYFAEENVPLPLEKTKRITRRCSEDEF